MEKKINVAVVGAMGLVGGEMIKTLERRNFPVAELRPLDIAANVGREVTFHGEAVKVKEACKENFKDIDIAIFSAGGDASTILAPQAVEMGAIVVDNSSAWRMDEKCPLVVPEVNPEDLDWHNGIIANPNCSTIQMVVALKPIHDESTIKRIVVSTYQAAAGAGKKGIGSLYKESENFLKTKEVQTSDAFSYQLGFNAIPHIDVFQEGGYTKEENKMIFETKKIMKSQDIRVTATCVRIPVAIGHSESVNVETEDKITKERAQQLLANAPSIILQDDPETNTYPMPLFCEDVDETMVGRVREDSSIDNGLNFWIVSNNVRKGAALNAVQIAETLIERKLV
ncbi:MAG: aspartate-semialdehyde dehydrogenase [Sphaerochaetaceae bacterium]|nr:aspartate-semialdehyde dehydrogenase [Sphaerochaetaceae bacterium]